MAVSGAVEPIKPVLAPGVRTRETHELLAVLLDAAGIDSLTIGGLALAS